VVEKYAHFSLFPDSRLHTEEEMLIEIRGLRLMFEAYQGSNFTIRSPNGQLYEDAKEFILGVLKGQKFFVLDETEPEAEVLHTADFKDVIGSWDQDIKREPYNCKHKTADCAPPKVEGIALCPDLDNAHCTCIEYCRERGFNYENKRFGGNLPKPLSGLVDKVLKEKL
jgi:hypothetical protein